MKSRTLPEALTSYDIKNERAEDDFYYFTFHGYIIKLNTDGNIVYYNEVDFPYNFSLHKTDEGESYYSYGAAANENDKIEGVGYQTIDYVIMNEAYEIIDSVESLVANEDIKENPLENHEFVLIDVGHYLVNSYYHEEVSNITEFI